MSDQLRTAVASAARRLALEGLLIGTAGNVSMRSGDRVAVTPSGLDLAACRLEDVAVVSLAGRVLTGRLQPTSELGLHLGVYADTDASAVVHTHAPYSTALACVLEELPVIHYQQLLLGGSVRVAPYATFGTPELAAHVRDALGGRQAALMANHGSVTVGTTLEQAVDHALLLEWLAALYHRASALGTVRVLSEEDQVAVITAALARGYGTPQENP
ncbi:MAG TPA: class II aldolase/adducin family protein [Nocardioides sp.]|uniref:class II aldolase/adducin family protein n=1 Tax=Nocardioides sp. TaxID=35761 RepID=UPI002C7645ED|nr:class II aldolase/adducin family protein [Nocardioides sp.]HTW15397.1 class II aldolase/adducin family protein [Nocardioides sp.]